MWTVRLRPDAERQFGRLPKAVQRDCMSLLDELAESGSAWDGEQLRKHERFERAKFHSGRFRIIYRVDKRNRVIRVTRIAKRDSKTYKGFNPA